MKEVRSQLQPIKDFKQESGTGRFLIQEDAISYSVEPRGPALGGWCPHWEVVRTQPQVGLGKEAEVETGN